MTRKEAYLSDAEFEKVRTHPSLLPSCPCPIPLLTHRPMAPGPVKVLGHAPAAACPPALNRLATREPGPVGTPPAASSPASAPVWASSAQVFGKDRAAFQALPAWRQQMAKKDKGLW